MDREKLQNELMYRTTIILVKRLISQGAVSENRYAEIDTIFLEKYCPVFGGLF